MGEPSRGPEKLPGFGLSEFNYIGDVYGSLEKNDRVIFLLRHSERPVDTGRTAPLTENGVAYARATGEALRGGRTPPNDVIYSSTDVVRTRQTAQNIAIGRGDTDYGSIESIDTSHADVLDGLQFSKSFSWPLISKYSCRFGELTDGERAQFNDKDTVARRIINGLTAALGSKKMGIFISHDFLLVPLSSWCADSRLDLNFIDGGKNNWICYLAGIGIVLREEHVYTVPVYSIPREKGANGYRGIMHGYGNLL